LNDAAYPVSQQFKQTDLFNKTHAVKLLHIKIFAMPFLWLQQQQDSQ